MDNNPYQESGERALWYFGWLDAWRICKYGPNEGEEKLCQEIKRILMDG